MGSLQVLPLLCKFLGWAPQLCTTRRGSHISPTLLPPRGPGPRAQEPWWAPKRIQSLVELPQGMHLMSEVGEGVAP